MNSWRHTMMARLAADTCGGEASQRPTYGRSGALTVPTLIIMHQGCDGPIDATARESAMDP